jgi:hypothetical protein
MNQNILVIINKNQQQNIGYQQLIVNFRQKTNAKLKKNPYQIPPLVRAVKTDSLTHFAPVRTGFKFYRVRLKSPDEIWAAKNSARAWNGRLGFQTHLFCFYFSF